MTGWGLSLAHRSRFQAIARPNSGTTSIILGRTDFPPAQKVSANPTSSLKNFRDSEIRKAAVRLLRRLAYGRNFAKICTLTTFRFWAMSVLTRVC